MIRTKQSATRVRALLEFWGVPSDDSAPADELFARLERELDAEASSSRVWETLAALRVQLPTRDEVLSLRRSIRLNGASQALSELPPAVNTTPFGEVGFTLTVTNGVVVDVHHTARVARTTGIQRVVRETVGRWIRQGTATPVVWSEHQRALRLLTQKELDGVLGVTPFDEEVDEAAVHTLVVPLGGTFVEAELAAETWQTERLGPLGQFSTSRLVAIGYDTVPVTSTETSDGGIAERFPRYLDALAWAERIATISDAAATEFRGWRRMLAASGRQGPEIETVFLAAETARATEEDLTAARALIGNDDDGPLVLVVGSHEPRKNHLAVLQAAERLWSAGRRLRLCFIGGNAWGNDRFTETIERLRSENRPVVVLSGVTDGLLAAGYELADFSLFPSLNEGFGLPVVESLTAGTPVITSAFGSMQEIADAFGGVVTVDPRDDEAIEAAIARLLDGPESLAALSREAAAARPKTWDVYAEEVFDYLVEGSTASQTRAA
jgi:glycosyltransferase involved in cell wall biosynthesis